PQAFMALAFEPEGRFIGFFPLEIGSFWHGVAAVAPVERAHVKLCGGKLRLNKVNDPACRLAIIDAYRDEPRLSGARRSQDVEPGAVAVINFEAKPSNALEHLRIVINRGDIDAFRKQALGHDLTEASKADNQHRTASIGEVIGLT